jgi:hypothetical protein
MTPLIKRKTATAKMLSGITITRIKDKMVAINGARLLSIMIPKKRKRIVVRRNMLLRNRRGS